jgi:hypothetical protein
LNVTQSVVGLIAVAHRATHPRPRPAAQSSDANLPDLSVYAESQGAENLLVSSYDNSNKGPPFILPSAFAPGTKHLLDVSAVRLA